MSYRILKSKINDTGIDTDQAIDAAIADLAAQVDAAEGWEPIGGVHTLSRQKPNGLRIWLLQAVWEVPKEAIQVEGTPEEAIARTGNKVIENASDTMGHEVISKQDFVGKDAAVEYLDMKRGQDAPQVPINRESRKKLDLPGPLRRPSHPQSNITATP